MLFDNRPKERIEDFYNFREELNKFIGYLKEGKPLILLLGLRRIGKTSLLKVGLNISGFPYAIVDLRGFEGKFGYMVRIKGMVRV